MYQKWILLCSKLCYINEIIFISLLFNSNRQKKLLITNLLIPRSCEGEGLCVVQAAIFALVALNGNLPKFKCRKKIGWLGLSELDPKVPLHELTLSHKVISIWFLHISHSSFTLLHCTPDGSQGYVGTELLFFLVVSWAIKEGIIAEYGTELLEEELDKLQEDTGALSEAD